MEIHRMSCDGCGETADMKRDEGVVQYHFPASWKRFAGHDYCPVCFRDIIDYAISKVAKRMKAEQNNG